MCPRTAYEATGFNFFSLMAPDAARTEGRLPPVFTSALDSRASAAGGGGMRRSSAGGRGRGKSMDSVTSDLVRVWRGDSGG